MYRIFGRYLGVGFDVALFYHRPSTRGGRFVVWSYSKGGFQESTVLCTVHPLYDVLEHQPQLLLYELY